MTFYLITPGQSGDTITDHNILGEISFKTFHAGIAWEVLNRLVDSQNETALKKMKIVDSSNKHWEIETFLTFLSTFRIVRY